VTRAAHVLNWVPNGAAKALASSQSRTIGALIPSLGHQNFGVLVEARRALYQILADHPGDLDEDVDEEVDDLGDRGDREEDW